MSTKTPVVTRYESIPCPVCDSNTKGCSLLEDGAQMCRGEPVDPSRWTVTATTGTDDFKLYRPVDPTRVGKGKKDKAPAPINWSAKAIHYASKMSQRSREGLAATLGVPVESLSLVPMVGVDGETMAGFVGVFPEVDADGIVVGLVRRDPSQEKKSKSMGDGKRGLTLAAGWNLPPGPVLVVEGATDVVACAAAGLCAVGRPGKDAKPELLVELFKMLPSDRPIILVGEHDQKFNADGTPKLKKDGSLDWPGRDAAEKMAVELALGLPNPVSWSMPPVDAKDSRAWLTSRAAAEPWADRGRLYLSHLTSAAVSIPKPTVLPPDPKGDVDGDHPDRWTVPFDAPQRLATAYLESVSPSDSPLRLRHWRDEFHEWRDGCYRTIPNGEMRSRLSLFIADEFVRVQRLYLAAWKRKPETAKFPQAAKVTTALVASVVAHLGSLCGVGMTNTDDPAWLGDTAARPPVQELAAFRNGLLHVTTGLLIPPTPEFFNFSVLAFDYNPAAPVPAEWSRFLAETWPDDREAIDSLQEWFGYLLTPDTRQQKMLWLVGPPRSGKGTTIEVLMGLIGEANVAAPTLQQLAEPFGLSSLLNTSLVWFDEPKISRHDNVPAIVGTIKRITGGSRVDVNRKGISILKNVRLGCRFVLSANEVLELGDASGAMASRVIVISTAVSKINREDKTLLERLKAVLPGIFNWALAGLPRLAARGRFVQPRSGLSDASQLRDLGSPTSQFLSECVVFDDTAELRLDSLFEEFKKWCEGENRLGVGTKIGFARDLNSQLPSKHRPTRKMEDGKKVKYYPGIRLRHLYESDSDQGPIWSTQADIYATTDKETSGQLSSDTVGVVETVQNDQLSRSNDQTNSAIPSDVSTADTSTYHHSGLLDQIKHKSGTDIVGGEEVKCEVSDKATGGCNGILSGHVDHDIYFDTDLNLFEYPINSLAEVIQDGPLTLYRVTPTTTVTLLSMLAAAPPGTPDQIALDRVLAAICDHLVFRYPADEIAAAEARGAIPLPSPSSPAGLQL